LEVIELLCKILPAQANSKWSCFLASQLWLALPFLLAKVGVTLDTGNYLVMNNIKKGHELYSGGVACAVLMLGNKLETLSRKPSD